MRVGAPALRSLVSEDIDPGGKLEIRATLTTSGRQDQALEAVANRMSFEPSVSAVSWEVVKETSGGIVV